MRRLRLSSLFPRFCCLLLLFVAAPAWAQYIAGRYDLYESHDLGGVMRGTMVIEGDGPDFSIAGMGWAGTGRFENGQGFYNWRFPDGRKGTGSLTLKDGNLLGVVTGGGPEVDWNYVARRREGPISMSSKAGSCWTISAPQRDAEGTYFSASNNCGETRHCRVWVNGQEPSYQVHLENGTHGRIDVGKTHDSDKFSTDCVPAA